MPKEYKDFEEWLNGQSEEVKNLVTQRFEALENTVKAVRGERDNLNHELKELSKKIEADSEAGKQLGELTTRLEAAERKANFIDSASKQGVIRPSAAYAIATSENLFTEKGDPDWNKIKESVPELFRVTNTNTNAGSGTQSALPKVDPNQIIRDAANNSNK